MRRIAQVSLSLALACTPREQAEPELEPSAGQPRANDQRVELELARVPDELAAPVIAELGLTATGLIAARHRIDEHWHIYWRNPGSAGLPTTVEVTLAEGSTLVVGPPILPAPDRFADAFGWEREVIVFLPISSQPSPGELSVRSEWVACRAEACVAGSNLATFAPATPGATLDPASPADPTLRAMLDRLPRPLGERLVGHAWTVTPEQVTLALELGEDAGALELLPDASDPALFFVAAELGAARTFTITWRIGSPSQPLPRQQGVLAWTDATRTRYFDLGLPWPDLAKAP